MRRTRKMCYAGEAGMPAALQRIALPAQEPLRFEMGLDPEIHRVLRECVHAGERALVICSTQRSARETAMYVASNATGMASGEAAARSHELRSLAGHGVGYSHGGVDAADRECTEAAFGQGSLWLLCTVGAALLARQSPRMIADIVLVKGGHKYAGMSRFEPYSASDRAVFASHARRLVVEFAPDSTGRASTGRTGQRRQRSEKRGSAKVNLEGRESHADLMELAATMAKATFRTWEGEGAAWAELARSTSVRFQYETRGNTADAAKMSLGAQAVMGRALAASWPPHFGVDCRRALGAMARAMALIAEAAPAAQGAALRNALELLGALRACAWHDDPTRVVAQIDGIGDVYAATLVSHGICSVADMHATSPGRLQSLLSRNPPFGHEVAAAARRVPQLSLEVVLVSGAKPAAELTFSVSAAADVRVLVCADRRAVLHRRVREACSNCSATAVFPAKTRTVVASIISAEHAGVNVHRTFELQPPRRGRAKTALEAILQRISDYAAPRSMEEPEAVVPSLAPARDVGMVLEANVPVAPGVPASDAVPGGSLQRNPETPSCRHRCADRRRCKHACCKSGPGTLRSHGALVAWLAQFRSAEDPAAEAADAEQNRAFLVYIRAMGGHA